MGQISPKIFIVEDEAVIAFEMTDSLEDMGFEVVGPSVHLEGAKRTAKESEFDVAFLDVNLGRGSTSEPVAGILRKRNIPFVFITAYDRDQVEFLSPEDRIINKLVSGEKLAEALRKILPNLKI